MAAYALWWQWADISRNRVKRPVPIEHRRVIPIYDGAPITNGVGR